MIFLGMTVCALQLLASVSRLLETHPVAAVLHWEAQLGQYVSLLLDCENLPVPVVYQMVSEYRSVTQPLNWTTPDCVG